MSEVGAKAATAPDDAFQALGGPEADIHLEQVTKRFGDMTAVDRNRFVLIERDDFQGIEAQQKKIY